jgi:hypothetical protein
MVCRFGATEYSVLTTWAKESCKHGVRISRLPCIFTPNFDKAGVLHSWTIGPLSGLPISTATFRSDACAVGLAQAAP